MKCEKSFFTWRGFFCSLAALVTLPWTLGATPAWSENSEPPSSSSSSASKTWSNLYSEGQRLLGAQSNSLAALTLELSTLQTGFDESTLLCRQLLLSNGALQNYNDQIATRMQDRDEDLAAAYNQHVKDAKTIRSLVIALITVGTAFALLVAVTLHNPFK
jgi:hypothetical protein